MAKRVAASQLLEGSLLSADVHSMSGKILLGKDTVLTVRHITLLKTWDVDSVLIHVDDEEDDVVAEDPSQKTVQVVPSAEYLQFVKEYDGIVTTTAQSFNIIRKRRLIPVSNLKDAAASIHSSISKNHSGVMNYLLISELKLADFIPRHSVMVAYFAGIIARQMKWSDEDIVGVAFASLLHDIGSLIDNKVGDPRIQVSIGETASLLREAKGLSSEILLGIVQHRERSNGSGVPNGTPGAKIHPYAKIIAVADYFQNLTYGEEQPHAFQILDVLTREMYGNFDPNVCQSLIERVRESLLFNKVLLSSGQEAEVIFFNSTSYCLPIVKTQDDQIVDLSQCSDVRISRLLKVTGV